MFPETVPNLTKQITSVQLDGVPFDKDSQLTHKGIENPRLNFPDLGVTGGSKTATFVIGPSSNSDSSTYDYTTDGTNDDVEIQAAIDALPSTGGLIVFREGTYTLGSATVAIAKNGVQLQGMGKGTIITCKNSFNATMFTLGHASVQYINCVIKDFYFNGNSANQTGTRHIIDNQASTVAINNLIITECYFTDPDTSAIISKGNNVVIIHNSFVNNTSGTYALDLQGQELVEGNYFSNTSTTARYISGSATTIKNNIFIVPASYNTLAIVNAFLFEGNYVSIGASVGSSFIFIHSGDSCVNNHIYFDSSANVAAIAIQSCEHIENNFISGAGNAILANVSCRIVGNKITANRGHMINVTAGTNSPCTITGNYLGGGGNAATDTYSIILIQGGNVTHSIIGNSMITGSAVNYPKYGIRENSASDGPNIITGNWVKGSVTDQISTQHTSTDVSHNITA